VGLWSLRRKSYGDDRYIFFTFRKLILFLVLQIAAAALAKVNSIVIHVLDGEEVAEKALALYKELKENSSNSVTNFIHQLHEQKLTWGLSNGT
jgi:hypothetical protein